MGGRGGRAGLGRPRGDRPSRPAGPLRPLHLHGRLQHDHQPPPVRVQGHELAHRVPLPRPHLPRHAGRLGRRCRLRAAPREGRDRRPHHHLAGGEAGAVLRRPLHLGLAQRRQPPESPALPARVGRRPAPHARPRRRVPPPRPRLPRRRGRPGPPGPDRHRGPPRLPGRPDPGRDERGRAPRRRHPHRAAPGRPGGPALPAPGLRRARVHRAHGVAPVRRLVGRQPGHAQAGTRARPGRRAGRARRRRRGAGRPGRSSCSPWPSRPAPARPRPSRPNGPCAWPGTWPSTPGWPPPRTRGSSRPAGRSSPPGRPGPLRPWLAACSAGRPTSRNRTHTEPGGHGSQFQFFGGVR